MNSKHPFLNGLVWRRLSRSLPRFLLSIGSFFVLVAIVGLVFGQRYLTTNQDTRSRATNPSGAVIVSLSANQSSINPGQTLSFTGTINTQNVQTDGIQLVLFIPKSAVNSPTLTLRPNIGLQQVLNRVVDTGSMYELQFIAVPQTIGQAFASSQAIPFLDITTTANQSGTYSLSADQARCLSTRHGSNPVVDELRPISQVNFTVTGSVPTQTPTPSPGSNPTPTPTPPNTATPTPTPSGPVVCDVSVPVGVSPAVQWIDANQIKLRWQDAPTATGFRIYLITDGTPIAGQPYVIWNVLENNAAVSEDAQFSPIETDLIKQSIDPTPNAQGVDEFTWQLPSTSVVDRTGAVVKNREYYRFLVYAYKVNENCHKQAAIGRITQQSATATPTPRPTTSVTPTIGPHLTATPTPKPTSTPSPTPLPSATPTPTPLPPTATPTPGRLSASLNVAFTQQGLRRSGVTLKTTVYLQENNPLLERPTPDQIYTFDAEFVSDQNGVLKLSTPLPLTNVPVSATGTHYDVWVKTPIALRKMLGNMTIMPGINQVPSSWETTLVRVGDFVQTPVAEWNTLNLLDISAHLAQYTRLQTPVTDANQEFDVTFDGKIDIIDIAVVLSNYTQLSVQGD